MVHRLTVLKAAMATILALGLSTAPAVWANPGDDYICSTVWADKDGKGDASVATLVEGETIVLGIYSRGAGWIQGTLREDRNGMSGYWYQDEGEQKCETEKNGTAYYGKLVWARVGDSNRFTGTWGACEAEPALPWTGTCE